MSKLSAVQNKTIEEYWTNLDELKKQLRYREWELLENKNTDENTGGGKANIISDTTANKAIILTTDERYQFLSKTISAVEKVYSALNEEMKEFADMRYRSKESNYLEWEDIAYELGVSKAKAFKMRNKLLDITASEIGWL